MGVGFRVYATYTTETSKSAITSPIPFRKVGSGPLITVTANIEVEILEEFYSLIVAM